MPLAPRATVTRDNDVAARDQRRSAMPEFDEEATMRGADEPESTPSTSLSGKTDRKFLHDKEF